VKPILLLLAAMPAILASCQTGGAAYTGSDASFPSGDDSP
jgi:hypothetical protein